MVHICLRIENTPISHSLLVRSFICCLFVFFTPSLRPWNPKKISDEGKSFLRPLKAGLRRSARETPKTDATAAAVVVVVGAVAVVVLGHRFHAGRWRKRRRKRRRWRSRRCCEGFCMSRNQRSTRACLRMKRRGEKHEINTRLTQN